MKKKLFTLKTQSLDTYTDKLEYTLDKELYISNVRQAMHEMSKELIRAVCAKIEREHTGYLIFQNSSIELHWKQDNLGGNYTYTWLEADVYVDTDFSYKGLEV